MLELAEVINSPDEDAANSAQYMGKSYQQFLKRQILKIPGKMLSTGRVICSIPSSSFTLIRVIKNLFTSLRDGLMATPVIQIQMAPRLKLKSAPLSLEEKAASSLKLVTLDPKEMGKDLLAGADMSAGADGAFEMAYGPIETLEEQVQTLGLKSNPMSPNSLRLLCGLTG